ncbi:SAV_6107 family HEPN domain-containing protein [Rhodococcus sp. OK519]|uniref:SAV_6107 family HEPN domain-containing protein n=1 Tax=Rhodococcus sp. OK519 TaxID=2135729 RepID=UPI0015E7B256
MQTRGSGVGAAAGFRGGASVRGPLSAPAKAVNLLRRADALLSEAAGAPKPADRFCSAYVGALRGAAAVLAATEGSAASAGSAGGRRPKSRSAWVLMARAEPIFAGWSDYFAGCSSLRADLEAGISRIVHADEADRFYVEVGRFLFEVEDYLGAGRG